MAHVQISKGDEQSLRILIDGVDLSDHVFREGLQLVQVGDDEYGVWGIQMILAPDVFDIDLPDAVVQATVREGKES